LQPRPPVICAHGGDTTRSPPNTPDSFQAAIDGGADCVEVSQHDQLLDTNLVSTAFISNATWLSHTWQWGNHACVSMINIMPAWCCLAGGCCTHCRRCAGGAACAAVAAVDGAQVHTWFAGARTIITVNPKALCRHLFAYDSGVLAKPIAQHMVVAPCVA
jgi:hypothetical protein